MSAEQRSARSPVVQRGGRPADLRPARTAVCFYRQSVLEAAGFAPAQHGSVGLYAVFWACVCVCVLCRSHTPEEAFELVSFVRAKR